MPVRMHKSINNVKKDILSQGAEVEDRLRRTVSSIKNEDLTGIQEIIDTDFQIDEREVEIEEECLKVLALYQPVALDLRFLITMIKINKDLERIADYTVNIAKRFKSSFRNLDKFSYDYAPMADLTIRMLQMSLDAVVSMDVGKVYEVRELDKDVNRMRDEAYGIVKEDVRKNPDKAGKLINMYLISRHLERIGDHITNIAEEVVYLIEGQIIRHT